MSATSRKPRPKGQHFVPALHLRHFVGDNPPGMLWTFDVQSAAWRPSIPEETAKETNFYTLTNSGGEHDDRIEQALSVVEYAAAAGYPKLIRGEVLNGEERDAFAMFVAMMFVRTPSLVRQVAEMHGQFAAIHAQIIGQDRSRFDALGGGHEGVDPDVADGAWELIQNPANYEIHVDQHAGLRVLPAADKLAAILVQMGWVVTGSDRPLITCDNPVFRVCPPQDHHPFYGDGGFANERVNVSMPLSPDRCLEMFWGEDHSGVILAGREHSMLKNRQRAYSADRYIYSMVRDEGLERLALKHKGEGPRLKMDAPGPLPEIRVKRKLS